MQPLTVLAVFPIIFLGELPDKTMFASLVMASRGRALAVWVGAAAAFALHVAIAVTIGVGVFAILPDYNGISIGVGRQAPGVDFCFDKPADVRRWLEQLSRTDALATS